MELRPLGEYSRAVRPVLPPAIFEPARIRLLWLPTHLAVIGSLAYAMTTRTLPAPLWPVASIVIGACMVAIAFLAHETLHGAIVRGRLIVRIVGFIGMLPFSISPTLWTNWHNRVHHNHCAQPGKDPDMYPTLEQYRTEPAARIMADYFGPGGRRVLSLIGMLAGFTGQSQQMLWNGRRLGILSRRQHRRAIAEFFLSVAIWAAVAFMIGAVPFVFVYGLGLVVANVIVMMFIVTNHNLSPLTPGVNDPLANSLSVTLPRPLEWLSLDFGYHVEHHLFPTVSARHGKVVRAALRAHFPDQYQSLPMAAALRELYRTGRVYQDNVTLIEPRSGQMFPTLQPRGDEPYMQ
jgi:fatty acid desaturase